MSKVIHKVDYSADELFFVCQNVPTEEGFLDRVFELFDVENLIIEFPFRNDKISICVEKHYSNDKSAIVDENGNFIAELMGEIIYLHSNVEDHTTKQKVCFVASKDEKIFAHSPQTETASDLSKYLFDIFYKTVYLMKNNIFELEEKTVKIGNSNNKKRNKRCKTKTKHYKFYTIANKDEIKRKLSSKRVITCNLWEVGGHYRRYKSGKVVYIKPYKKGKDRNENSVIYKEHLVLPK